MSELHRRWRWFLGLFNGQAYYWTREWQAGEREAAAERAAGRSLIFDSRDPNDVVRWLRAGSYTLPLIPNTVYMPGDGSEGETE